MALVGNILLGTSTTPAVSSIASAVASAVANSELSSRIPWNSLEYSGTVITAISGSAIGGQGGGGGDTSQCMPISGMTAYQPVSSISSWTADMSAISSKQDKLTFGYDGDKISSIDGSALAGGGGGVTPADVSAIASSYANDKLDKTASSTFQPSGNYAYASSLSSYLPKSASSNFAPAGDYAFNSSLTGYLKNSASSTWYPYTGNPSGFLTQHQSLSGYVPKSSISSQSAVWNTVSAMVPKSSISAQSSTWNTVSAMTPKSSISGKSATWNTVSAKVDKSAISSWSSNFVYKSAVSGWSAQIAALSAAISAITANKYTLSAGAGIAITNNTSTKVTTIATA